MIKSWRGTKAKTIYAGAPVRGLDPAVYSKARRKLMMLDAARTVNEAAPMPGDRLHMLRGDLDGHWSVSVTMQQRITFRFEGSDAYEVWFGDYH